MTQSDSHKVTSFPQMPCKLEEDYSEYDDPDDFFPDIPTVCRGSASIAVLKILHLTVSGKT